MAVPLSELIKNPERINELKLPPQTCAKCGDELTDAMRQAEEIRTIDGKEVCADCYFRELGGEVEQHPISHPRVRRG